MRAVVIESKGAEPRLVEDDQETLLGGLGTGGAVGSTGAGASGAPGAVPTGAAPGPVVELDVLASSLNYKDAMALDGRGIARTFPLIPGIDLVGRVTASSSSTWDAGDLVVLNGDGIGESRNGGFATRALVRPDALVRVPAAFSIEQAAAIGTAGFTAMLAVLRLEEAGLTPDDGDVLVTGASGGAGSIAVALLSGRGYRVVASTGRVAQNEEYLRGLGAAEVIDRAELGDQAGKPLQSQRFAGAVDGVGSTTLANVLAQIRWGGTAAAYGLAQGPDLPATVLPFILRHVTLAGVNSVDAPLPLRERAWDALAQELDPGLLEGMTATIGLSEVIEAAPALLDGQVRGRTVVDTGL